MPTNPTFNSFALATYAGVSLYTRLVVWIRSAYHYFIPDSFLLRHPFLESKKSEWVDIEGPFYIPNAPSRLVADGKGVLATRDELKEEPPFLLSLCVRDDKGNPVPNVELDWWQADSKGEYYFTSYTLRGKFTTDSNGYAEGLSIVPGEYGPEESRRPGHVHLKIRDPNRRFYTLTTQVYICNANDKQEMYRDFVQELRKPRLNLVLQAWSIPSVAHGKQYMELPELSGEDTETTEKVTWWNSTLAGTSVDAKIVAGGHMELRLTPRPSGLLGLIGL
ncbi:aromatic compound dioxygenase [Obba rivulosa]|uniref:Aromatic compound dioxygenase n=1 Tax=Obba rivulosa TaxID=1052685 RepID=A0A8E2ANH7_9APHY|nr:aromatic compound dioxygenase [Obba rivulosa]